MKKLAIAQIALGILVVGSLIYWMGWLSTGYYHSVGVDPDGNVILHILGLHKLNPFMGIWTVIYLMLGLSVIGCGIAECFRVECQKTADEDKQESGDDSKAVNV